MFPRQGAPARAFTSTRRAGVAAIIATAALVLTACTGSPEVEVSPSNSSAFDQELHDLLPEHIRDSGKIIVAGAFDNPPALYVDVNDPEKALGIAPDLAVAVGEILGVSFEWVNTQFPGQLPGLDAGTFDAIWGQVGTTEERELGVIDMIPFSQNGLGLLVPAGNPGKLSGWESMCGKRIGVTIGAILADVLGEASEVYCLSSGLPAIEVAEFQGSEHSAILSGNVDAGFDTYTVARTTAESQSGDFSAVEIPKEQSFEFYPGLAAIGVSKENPGLSNALAAALQILAENGEFEAIMKSHDAASDMPDSEFIKVNPLTGTPAGEVAAG